MSEFDPHQRAVPDEPNLDEIGDRCYGIAAVGSGGARAMSEPQAAPPKPSLLADDPRRLASLSPALRLRKTVSLAFHLGIACGVLFG